MREPDEMDEALNNGFAAVKKWQAAQMAMAEAVEGATDALIDAMELTSLSLREIARRSKLSATALSELKNGNLENLSSTATRRVLLVIQLHAATPTRPEEGAER